MHRGHLLIVSVLCCLCAVGPLVVCLLVDEWYVVMSFTNNFKVGLSQACTVPIEDSRGHSGSTTRAVCGAIDYDLLVSYARDAANVTASAGYSDRGQFQCSVQPSVDEAKLRFTALQGLIIAALALGAVQGFAGIVIGAVRTYRVWARVGLAVLSVVSAGLVVAASVLYPLTMELWLFCGQRYCTAIGSPYTECTNYLGFGYAMLCCGAGLLVLNAAVTLVLSIRGWDEEVQYWAMVEEHRLRAEKERQIVIMDDPWANASREAAAPTAPEEQPKRRRGRYPNEPPLPLELQAGDWEYDPDTGYFWSEESELYFEPETQQFYDPRSDAWFNPETELWYRPLVQTEGDLLRPRGDTVARLSQGGEGHHTSPATAVHVSAPDKESVPFG